MNSVLLEPMFSWRTPLIKLENGWIPLDPVTPNVTIVANTLSQAFGDGELIPSGILPHGGVSPGMADLVEFAGRNCYQSWDRPNPATADPESYARHIIKVGHLSTFEHVSVTFYITGVSRSLTHELVRHRHLSYSQLSQRYVPADNMQWVCPPALRDDPEAKAFLGGQFELARNAYKALIVRLDKSLSTMKQVREAARAALPNMTETKIVVTGNLRAWRHFLRLRATFAADAEIREVAIMIYHQLNDVAPELVQDATLVCDDGVEILTWDKSCHE